MAGISTLDSGNITAMQRLWAICSRTRPYQ